MAHNAPIEIASTLQSASIQRHPSPRHDLNPSTAASRKEPVRLAESRDSLDDVDDDDDEIPVSVLRPIPRKQNLPPLPDLRFEQSYLKSIEHATGWWGWKGIGWITFRDQIMLPLIQGTVWSLVLHGWRHWNRSTKFSGRSVGAKIRRWWWSVNNWKIPAEQGRYPKLNDKKFAGRIAEYYKAEFSNAGSD